ncbi:helix-turn-helix domain-containing protein [Bradyrhizobium sp. CCBAU 53338]|uniref:helix-turn-helix domain-containing protein n=1 Tax=Bradyrhizobium sp. CCBAU 53338 TaxID=1325111 RepID=UPI001FEF9986|nr:helix-turn-helix domain-containing protein [Bradyrhizobium sp. CCBAU 53338]
MLLSSQGGEAVPRDELQYYPAPNTPAWTTVLDSLALRASAHRQDPSAPFAGATHSADADVDAWQQRLRKTFCDLEIEPFSASSFSARLSTLDRGELKVSFLLAPGQSATRSMMGIRKAPVETFFLNIHLHANGFVEHRDGVSQINAGEAVLIDAMQPYRINYRDPFRAACIQFPQSWLRERGESNLDSSIARRLPRDTGAPRVLAAAVETLIESNVPGSKDDISVELFLDVLSTSLKGAECGNGPLAAGVAMRAGLLRRYLAQTYREECLTPAIAATALGWSVRNLHKICQDSGTSFGKMLLNMRLAASAQKLVSAKQGQQQISELALECGFRDISHFCRAFKQRYGLSPSRYALYHR